MPRKATGFRLEQDLLDRMDAAVVAGVAKNRTALIELALEKVLQGMETGRFDPRSDEAKARAGVPKEKRLERARSVIEGDGTPLPKIAVRKWS